MENHEPPIVLVPGFLGSDSHWDVEAIRDRYQSSRFLTTHPGPLSSHHDRACELFYSLKGGVVDYGAEHACRCDHARSAVTRATVPSQSGTSRTRSILSATPLAA